MLCPVFSLSVCSDLMQEESLLMLAQQDPDLWVEQNVNQDHFIAMLLVLAHLL